MPWTRRRAVWLAALACGEAWAQGTTSRAVGIILDGTGGVVADAKVTLLAEATNQKFTTRTATAGTYFFEALQPGLYTVTVEAPGFRKFSSTGNRLTIGQPMTVNATLEVGSVAETVEVAGSFEAVQTSTSGNFGNLFEGQVIRDLPIVGTRGRNPLQLVERQPGVVSGANTGGGVHVHGARDRAWNFTLDGIDINDFSAGGSNFAPLRTNPDSLSEFRVITSNATAEYGRNSGAQVAMVTRSGTNNFHGDAFWFYRTPRLNANEWQNNLNDIGKRQFVQHIPGASFAGPIRRNHTFFFGNLQLLRARETAATNRTVLTETARRGVFRYVVGGRNFPAGTATPSVDASGNVLPGVTLGSYNIIAADPNRAGANRRVQELINRTPLPNNFNGGDGLNTALFTFPAVQTEKQYDTVFKVDHVFNGAHVVYARIALGEQKSVCDRGNGGSEAFPGSGCIVDTTRTPRNYAFNWRTTPSPSVTNELVFGINNYTFDFFNTTPDLSRVTLQAPLDLTLPETFEFGNLRELTNYQFVDNAAWMRGAHSFKLGANLRFQRHRDQRGSIAGWNANQVVNFDRTINVVDPAAFGLPRDIQQANDRPNLESTINFLLGRVGRTARGFSSEGGRFASGLYRITTGYNEYDFYFQDTWKVRRNLTIDAGLRWEMKLAPTATGNRSLAPDQLLTAGANPTNSLRWVNRKLFDNDMNNLGPSVGVAWDPFGTGKTSIRGNYRVAYDRINTFVASSAVFPNLPGISLGAVNTEYGQAGGRLDGLPALQPPSVDPAALAQPAAFSLNNITVFDPAFRMPTTHQWGISIQREVLTQTVLELNYIGRRAYGLFGAYNANQTEIYRNGFLEAFRTVKAGGESALINQLMGPDSRLQLGETGSRALRRIFASDLALNNVGAIAANLAQRVQNGRSLPDLAGLGPYFFQAFPQFAGGAFVIDANDFSTYHGVEIQLERRLNRGVAWQLSYTFAKSLDTRSFDPAFTVAAGGAAQSASSTPFDLANRKLNYALSDFDRTHVVQSYWTWEVPFGRKHPLGGWQLSGFLTVQGGRPFTVFSGTNTVSNVVSSAANCAGCTRADGAVFNEGGRRFYFDAAQRAKFSNPGPGEFGSTGRNFFRSPGSFSADVAFRKVTRFNERVSLELRADISNLTNTPTFNFPTANIQSATFGRIFGDVISGSRKIQLGAKFAF